MDVLSYLLIDRRYTSSTLYATSRPLGPTGRYSKASGLVLELLGVGSHGRGRVGVEVNEGDLVVCRADSEQAPARIHRIDSLS